MLEIFHGKKRIVYWPQKGQMCPETQSGREELDRCTPDLQSQEGEMMNESEIQVRFAQLEERLAAHEIAIHQQDARIETLLGIVEEDPEETPEVPEEE